MGFLEKSQNFSIVLKTPQFNFLDCFRFFGLIPLNNLRFLLVQYV
jgi:hypothetical protein